MRVLTDMELGSVVGGQSAQEMQSVTTFCSQNPTAYYERTRNGRGVSATVAGTGVTIGGGSTTVVVDCSGQGRTNGNDDDEKKEES